MTEMPTSKPQSGGQGDNMEAISLSIGVRSCSRVLLTRPQQSHVLDFKLKAVDMSFNHKKTARPKRVRIKECELGPLQWRNSTRHGFTSE